MLDPPPSDGTSPAVAGARTSRPKVTRLENDIDRHIRRVKGGKFQARPIDLGIRYDLGLFDTIGEARKAVTEFWWGKRQSLPRFTKKVQTREGDRFIVLAPDPARPGRLVRVGDRYETREAAAVAVEAWIAAVVEHFPKWQKNVTEKERRI